MEALIGLFGPGKVEDRIDKLIEWSGGYPRELIRRAADATFQDRAGGVNTDDLVMYFDTGSALQVSDDAVAPEHAPVLLVHAGLIPVVRRELVLAAVDVTGVRLDPRVAQPPRRLLREGVADARAHDRRVVAHPRRTR